jgi:hypothetical protein
MAEKTVAEQVQELTERWNPPTTDHTLERLVGVPTDPADVAATSHVPMEELNKSFTNSDVDAQRLQEFQDDGDDGDDLESMDKAGLKAEAEKRDLAVSGSKKDLLERIREHDAGGDDEE